MSSSNQIKIDSFNPSKISLELWLSLLEANFSNLEITDEDKKKNVLLVSVGTDVFSVLGNLCAPDLPHTKSYAEILNVLKGHYVIKPSYHRSLITFQQRNKRKEESFKELYADLKAAAKNCNFGNLFDARVGDQLFIAVDNEVYFPNLVALNIDLQTMTSQGILDKILNMEKAFVSERVEIQPQAQAHVVKGKSVLCKHCGFSHDSMYCRFKHLTCNNCNKRGHLQKVCKEGKKDTPNTSKYDGNRTQKREFSSKSKFTSKRIVKNVEDYDCSDDDEDDEGRLLTVTDKIYAVKGEQFYFNVNGSQIPFEIDSGATVSTVTKDWVEKLNVKEEKCRKNLQAYDNSYINVLGKVTLQVQYNGFNVPQIFYVVGSNNENLCGKDLMAKIGIYIAGLDECTRVNNVDTISPEVEHCLANYHVDANLPISNIVAKIHLKSDAIPKFVKTITPPYFQKEMIEAALDKLISDGVLVPISHSEWAAPIVPVMKENKKEIRICASFKALNKQIQCDRYPLPKIDELLSVIGKGKIFSKIDLKNAYLQIPVDEESQEFLVINTHKGLFKYTRLPFGLSSSPGIFQRFISQLLSSIEGVAAYMDDIVVSGATKEEHDERLKQVLDVLQSHNVQINKKKTVLNMDTIEYLGYNISGEGIKPSPRKVEAIVDAPCPTSVAEVQSFLGMVTFYCKFVKNFSTKAAPLYELLKKGARFKWTKLEQQSFNSIKDDLAESKLLANFDGESPLMVEVDASPVGVGCVLLQKIDGHEKPIYFASKKLTSAEIKYSQIDKEGLALVFALKRFRYFLLGRHFVARTDHKPLLGLFGKEKPIPQNANARIQRWALFLSQYNYDFIHKPGKENVIADALSRLPVEDDFRSSTPAEYVRLVELCDFGELSFNVIKQYTNKDVVLSELVKCLKLGWSTELNVSLIDYSIVKKDLSLHNNVVLYRNRIVIPVELRCKVLNHLHNGHNGISAMKAEARKWVWWPKIDQDLAEMTKNCNVCFANYKQPPSTTLSWPSAGKPWSRLHIDYAGPVDGKYFLIVVDSFSKFMDIQFSNSVTSSVTISHLRRVFSNFGLPDIVVSDNAPNFVSQEMKRFFQKNGVKHVCPAPYHPASNGLAERAVRTFKEGLAKFKEGDLQTRICRFLYNYRRTVHSATGKAPAEIMFNRNFRGTVESVQFKEKFSKGDGKIVDEECMYKVNDAVFARNFGKGPLWVEGRIVEILGLRNFKVQVQSAGNIVWRRHADQLMPRYLGNFNQVSTGMLEQFGDNCNQSSPELLAQYRNYKPTNENEGNTSNVGVSTPSCSSSSTNVSFETYNDAQSRDLNVNDESISELPVQTPVLRRSQRIIQPPDRLNL